MTRATKALLDAIVVGGGPAGLIAARELARAGRSVALVERSTYGAYRVGELIAAYARTLLEELDLSDVWKSVGARPCDGIVSAWGTEDLALRRSIESAHGTAMAVDRRRFDHELARAAERAGAELHIGARAESVSWDGKRFTVELGSRRLRARRLIDATGRRAWCCKKLGGRRIVHDRLVGVGRRLGERSPLLEWKDVLLLESAPDGYWYTIPLPDGPMAAVWLSDGDLHAADAALPGAPHTASRIGDLGDPSELSSWDASSGVSWEPDGVPMIAAGDAALSCDPLAADGVVRAIVSGREAARAMLGGAPDAPTRKARRAEAWRAYLDERGSVYAMERRWRKHPFWARRAAVDAKPPWIDPAQPLRVDEPNAVATARAEALLGARPAVSIMKAAARKPRVEAHRVLTRARGAHGGHGGAPDPTWVRALEVLIEDGALMLSAP